MLVYIYNCFIVCISGSAYVYAFVISLQL